MTDLTRAVRQFMLAADCTIDRHNPKQASLYIGLILEEGAEILEAAGNKVDAAALDAIATAYKAHNGSDFETLTREQRAEMLDGCIDLAWVALGLAYSIGGDPECAQLEVIRANLAKVGPDGKMLRDANGKVRKPAGWTAPEMMPFVK